MGQSEFRTCHACRKRIPYRASFCPECGAEIREARLLQGAELAQEQFGGTTSVPDEERLQRLAQAISSKTIGGWNVIDRNDREVTAVLSLPGKSVNHVLHLLLALVTCGLWLLVWAMWDPKKRATVAYINRRFWKFVGSARNRHNTKGG